MAFINKWIASITVYDTAKRSSTVSFNVAEASAEAWINAADETARAATAIGDFFQKFSIMTKAAVSSYSVQMVREQADLVAPADAYRGNKAITTFNTTSGVPVRTSIPAYQPLLVPLKTNSIEIDVAVTADEYFEYMEAFHLIALSNQGSDVTSVIDGYVND